MEGGGHDHVNEEFGPLFMRQATHKRFAGNQWCSVMCQVSASFHDGSNFGDSRFWQCLWGVILYNNLHLSIHERVGIARLNHHHIAINDSNI